MDRIHMIFKIVSKSFNILMYPSSNFNDLFKTSPFSDAIILRFSILLDVSIRSKSNVSVCLVPSSTLLLSLGLISFTANALFLCLDTSTVGERSATEQERTRLRTTDTQTVFRRREFSDVDRENTVS